MRTCGSIEAKAMAVINQMTKEIRWLNYCVNECTISDVLELYNLSDVFEKEDQKLAEKILKKVL